MSLRKIAGVGSCNRNAGDGQDVRAHIRQGHSFRWTRSTNPIEPKLKLIGESFAVVPVPLRATFCGLPAALSVIRSAAVRVPGAVGLNRTLILQLAPTAREVPQPVFSEKLLALVPVMAMLLIVNLAVPVFLSVTVLAALVVPIA